MHTEQYYLDRCQDIRQAIETLISDKISSDTKFLKKTNALLDDWQSKVTPFVEEYSSGTKAVIFTHMKFNQQGKGPSAPLALHYNNSYAFIIDPRGKLSTHHIRYGKKVSGYSKFTKALRVNKGASARNICKQYQRSSLDTLQWSQYKKNILNAEYGAERHFILEHLKQSQLLRAKNDNAQVSSILEEVDGHLQKLLFLLRANATRQLQSGLDQNVLSVIEKSKNWDLTSYNWTLGNTEQQADFRMGALQSYPGLGQIFTVPHYSKNHHKKKIAESVTELIDKGKSIALCLTETFENHANASLHKSTFRGFHGHNRNNLGQEGLKAVYENADIISLFPPQDIPDSPQAWTDFNEFSFLLKKIEKDFHKPVPALIKNEKLNQNELFSMGVRIDDRNFNGNTSTKLENAKDFVQAIYKYAVLPQIIRRSEGGSNTRYSYYSIGQSEIMQHAQSLMTFKQIMKSSDHWHDRVNTFYAKMTSLGVVGKEGNCFQWAPLTDTHITSNGVKFEPLTTKGALEAEGIKMDHCVGGYASNCILGTSHIYHVTYEENGKTYSSTLQLSEKSKDKSKSPKLVEMQNKAEGNNPPHPVIQKAANQFITELNNGAIPVDWEHINEVRNQAREDYNKNKWVSELGFDPIENKACEQAFEILKSHCHGQMSKMTLHEWLEKTGLQKLLEEKHPVNANNRQEPVIARHL